MANVKKSSATLRIIGADLDPKEITALLGAEPTYSEKKGESVVSRRTGNTRIAKTGMWRLLAADYEPEDLNRQIREILSQLTDDLEVWRGITAKYRCDLFCGLFLKFGNEGMILSAKSLAALGERGIKLGLDIYSGSGSEE